VNHECCLPQGAKRTGLKDMRAQDKVLRMVVTMCQDKVLRMVVTMCQDKVLRMVVTMCQIHRTSHIKI